MGKYIDLAHLISKQRGLLCREVSCQRPFHPARGDNVYDLKRASQARVKHELEAHGLVWKEAPMYEPKLRYGERGQQVRGWITPR